MSATVLMWYLFSVIYVSVVHVVKFCFAVLTFKVFKVFLKWSMF